MKNDCNIVFEKLKMNEKKANEYLEVIQEFLESFKFDSAKIGGFDCRSRDGFSPYSHNFGGLRGLSYQLQSSAYCGGTGFEKVDEILESGREYDLKCFLEDRGLTEMDYDDQVLLEQFDETCFESDDTIEYQIRVMMTSDTSAQVDCYVSASDSPYHRTSDEKLELDIKFKTPQGMKKHLDRIAKKPFLKRMKLQIREGF